MTTTSPELARTIRQRAEEQFSAHITDPSEALSPGETTRLLHELQVHQIDLEMQNEELKNTQLNLEILRDSLALQVEKRTEELSKSGKLLRQNLDLLNFIIDKTSDAVYAKDIEGRYILFNKATAAITGKSAAEMIGNDDTAPFDSETAHTIMELDREIRSSGEAREVEHVHISIDGKEVVANGIKRPLLDEQTAIGDKIRCGLGNGDHFAETENRANIGSPHPLPIDV